MAPDFRSSLNSELISEGLAFERSQIARRGVWRCGDLGDLTPNPPAKPQLSGRQNDVPVAEAAGLAERGRMGIEPPAASTDNPALLEQGGAESGALATQSRRTDPNLASLLTARPTLPAPIRAAILATVRAART